MYVHSYFPFGLVLAVVDRWLFVRKKIKINKRLRAASEGHVIFGFGPKCLGQTSPELKAGNTNESLPFAEIRNIYIH